MDRRTVLLSGAAFTLAACATSETAPLTAEPASAPAGLKPPAAKQDPKTITQLGRIRVDEYQWMKDDNWQQVMRDPAVLRADIREHLEAENAYSKALMADTQDLQAKMFEEMKGRIKQDDSTVPERDGPYEYYARFEMGAQHPIYARKAVGQQDAREQVLLDVDAMAKGKAFFSVGRAAHSPDHRMLAYSVDDQGSEVWKVYVKDLGSGETLPDPIDNCAYSIFAWAPGSKYLFWAFRDDNGRNTRIYRRPVRGGAKDDVLVYEEADPRLGVSVSVSESQDFILILSSNGETTEVRVIPAADPTAAPVVFAPRVEGQIYYPTHWQGRWHVVTNADGATDFKVMTCEVGKTDRANWKELIPHKPGRYIEGLTAFKQHLVRFERENALPRIVVRSAAGEEHAIAQAEEAYDLAVDPGYMFDTPVMRYVYQSPSTPRQWFDYDMNTRSKTLRKTQEVPSGHDPAKYQVKRFTAKAPDGAEVPITVLMKAGQPLDGSAPLLLYGYGSYGISQDATFVTNRLSLVDRGWVWAVAHVRGGADKGRSWFEDARKDKKKNTFTDFIAVAEELVRRGYARKGRIVSYGGSAGGLLVGAVANMAPDGLFGGHIGAVPFVDVVNTMSDESLPLTPGEWPEWGNPITDPAAYDYIASYCPYTNVADKPYPPILATGGLSDPRVTYWEPAKWVARLRARAPNGGPYLLVTNMEAGHGGASGRFDRLKEVARDLAFAMKALGEKEAGGPFAA